MWGCLYLSLCGQISTLKRTFQRRGDILTSQHNSKVLFLGYHTVLEVSVRVMWRVGVGALEWQCVHEYPPSDGDR